MNIGECHLRFQESSKRLCEAEVLLVQVDTFVQLAHKVNIKQYIEQLIQPVA